MKPNYNIPPLDIATAHSRLSKTWKNKKYQWADLVERCMKTTRTGESVAEYMKMTREEQSNVKDVGGFVGGYLSGGTRKTANVMWRSVATLDLDYATPDVWDDFTLQFSFAAILYSTHKHTPEKPRYRLVFPFSRPVKPAEYEPICRKIAEALGIDLFDITTYQLPRLFYWPSTSRDGEYVFHVQEGHACDPDSILASYVDYRDASAWPVSSREGNIIAHEIRKAGDPTEKGGLIGAFCRTYTIEEAIDKFLPDVYEKTATEGRYTYKMGSVAGGLVCYEGKFAYSHHETDPTSRQLCNAFDLVRIHLFGVFDEGSRVTDITRLPSYLKMQDFAAADKDVRVLLTRERQAGAEGDFADVDLSDTAESAPSTDWMQELEYDRKGAIKPTAKNYEAIALNDPNFKNLKYDLFTQSERIMDPNSPFKGTHAPDEVDDVSLSRMCSYVENAYNLKLSPGSLCDKMLNPTAVARSFHSVKDYILSETWDGVPRVETLFIDYLGADDTPLVRAITRKWMAAAVTRALEKDPLTGGGVKFDHIVVFYSGQGTGKSTMAETLASRWHGSVSLSDGKKEQCECLQRSWIVETPEFKGVKQAETESVKDLISRVWDDFRPAYARKRVNEARHSVFIGSTNNRHFLKDVTGNRRYWVIPVKGRGPVYLWRDKLRAVIGQVWAEAYQIYKNGETLYLTDEMQAEMDSQAEDFTEAAGDPLRDYLSEWLDIPLPADWATYEPDKRRSYFKYYDPLKPEGSIRRQEVTICEIINECDYKGLHKYSSHMIGGILKSLGWEFCEQPKRVKGYRGNDGKNKISRYYKRPSESEGENEDDSI